MESLVSNKNQQKKKRTSESGSSETLLRKGKEAQKQQKLCLSPIQVEIGYNNPN